MKKILGLDIGTESIGWALVQQSEEPVILSMGVHTFSSFISNLGEGKNEISFATNRAKIRNSRKLYFRKTYRKRKMLLFLAESELCPLTKQELTKWLKNHDTPGLHQKINPWFAMNPYELRAKGLKEKLSKLEFGRVLYHMIQRRGKVMNQAMEKSNAKALNEGLPAANRLGIMHTKKKLGNQKLGEYLFSLLPKKNEQYNYQEERVRNRYLDRAMFEDELSTLFDQQQQHHNMITKAFRHFLLGDEKGNGLIFYQRPAQYKKLRGGLASCLYEPNKKAMWQSHPINEWHQIYSWLDSITLYNKKLNAKQRTKALGVALQFSSFMFKKVRIALGVNEQYAFNYQDNDKIQLAHTLVHLTKKRAFDKAFFTFTEQQQIELWHDLFFYTDKKKLIQRLGSKWGLNSARAGAVASIKLKPGYGNISLKAARVILAYLKKGHDTTAAVSLGGVQNAIGQAKWRSISEQTQQKIETFVLDSKRKNLGVATWKAQFQAHFDVDINTNKLYLFNKKNKADHLPEDSTDDQQIFRRFKPVVQKPVLVLRRLVNELLQAYGKIDQIQFALTPELKVNAKGRQTLFVSKKLRDQELPSIHHAVVELGHNPTHKNLFKYKLWLEWSKTCPYTNTKISLDQLFTEEVSIVYIHPWKRFFNDSDKNKTLCMTFFKDEIASKTPYEYFSSLPPGTWEKVKTRVLQQLFSGAAKYNSYQRFRHFVQSVYANNNSANEFDDQHHIALKIKSMLEQVSAQVIASRGNTISSIKRKWGLNSIYAFDTKSKHHDPRESGLNALIIGLNNISYVEELSFWNRYAPLPYREPFPTPWASFSSDALKVYQTMPITVDSDTKVVRKIANKKGNGYSLAPKGKLHKDSYFGKRQTPDGQEGYHISKPVTSISTAKQVSKIVDPAIRELVYDQIDLHGGFKNGRIPPKVLYQTRPTGWETKIFLPNKHGDKVPVRKVRVREKVGNAVQLSEGQNKYVNPRNNHHVLIYQTLDGKFQEHVVTFWEAVRRIRQHEPMYQLPDDGRMIITTLHTNDCFILGLNPEEIHKHLNEGLSLWEYVYRVQRISSKYYEFKHIYDLDIYDQSYPNYVRILNFGDKKTGWKTHKPFKIHVSILGKISPFYQPIKVPEMP